MAKLPHTLQSTHGSCYWTDGSLRVFPALRYRRRQLIGRSDSSAGTAGRNFIDVKPVTYTSQGRVQRLDGEVKAAPVSSVARKEAQRCSGKKDRRCRAGTVDFSMGVKAIRHNFN